MPTSRVYSRWTLKELRSLERKVSSSAPRFSLSWKNGTMLCESRYPKILFLYRVLQSSSLSLNVNPESLLLVHR